jgi:hypothetical protein
MDEDRSKKRQGMNERALFARNQSRFSVFSKGVALGLNLCGEAKTEN